MENSRKFYRSRTDKIIAGVCGGLGEYFNIDSLIFRLIFLVLLFAGGSGFWVYIILAIVIPKSPLPGQPDAPNNPRENAQNFAQDIKAGAHRFAAEMRSGDYQQRRGHRHMWLGLLIVVIGSMALMNQIFPQYWFRAELFWPMAIIFVGLVILSRSGNKN